MAAYLILRNSPTHIWTKPTSTSFWTDSSSTAKVYEYTAVTSRVLPMYFTDGALLVYKTLIEKKPGIADDWERLTKELTKSFGNRCAIPANKLINVVKHNDETTSAFYNRVRTLAAQVYPNQDERGLDDIIRTHFISGLDQATQVF